MAAKADNADDMTICPICFEQFTNPKCLPCHHTFCFLCLRSYIITQLGGEGMKAKTFSCPVCRQGVAVTDLHLTSEKIADTMPDNCLITSLMEKTGHQVTKQDEKLCGPCTFRSKTTFAISWCKYCDETLCENCSYHHEGFKQLKHEIIKIADITEEKSANLLDTDEPCMKHTGKVLEVFCLDHKEMCCVICLATLHRKCENISTFEEMVTGSKDYESIEQFADGLIGIEKKVDDLKIKVEKNISRLNSRHDEICNQVVSTVQQTKDKLDHLQSSFMKKFQQTHKGESVNLTERKERIEVFQKNIKKGQTLLKAIQEHGTPKQIFITKEKLKLQLKHHIEDLKFAFGDRHCIDYTLNIDDIVIYFLNVLTSVAEADVKSTIDLDVLDYVFKEKQPNAMKDHIIYPGGKITGGTFLSDGNILLCCYTNKKLQVFDKTLSYLFETDCENESPIDACLVSANNIVVSFFEQTYLRRYEIKGKAMKELRKIPCKKGPSGLAAIGDNIIVGYSNQIDILSMDGRVVRNFTRKGENVSCVAVSLTGNVYYNDGNYVVCKTLDGREIRRFSSPSLKGLTGIAVDRLEDVFVCGFRSYNVCKFSSDGHNCKVLVTGVVWPLSIGLDNTESNIYIATSKDGCHFYRLKI